MKKLKLTTILTLALATCLSLSTVAFATEQTVPEKSANPIIQPEKLSDEQVKDMNDKIKNDSDALSDAILKIGNQTILTPQSPQAPSNNIHVVLDATNTTPKTIQLSPEAVAKLEKDLEATKNQPSRELTDDEMSAIAQQFKKYKHF